jgi:hypothetical protein
MMPDIDTELDELAHWIAKPLSQVDIIKRAERVINLFREREKALRLNLDIATKTIKDLQEK